MASSQVVVVSNRGPVAFEKKDGETVVPRRAAGGLVNALGPAVDGIGATWIAGAMSDADREAAEQGLVEAEGYRLRLLSIEPRAYRAYYDVISNSTLWYLYHGMFDAVRRPAFDRRWREAWQHYREVNALFAQAVADDAPPEATVLVHDYHMALLGPLLAKERPDLRTVHFHHTPFCTSDELRMLPVDVAEELIAGLATYSACGFHVARWAQAFTSCCETVLKEVPRTFISPATANLDDVREAAASASTSRACEELATRIGDRKVIARNDRIELSKNVLRGFLAFDELLETRPEWRERVCFVAYEYPSRQTIADYLAYRSEIEALAARINGRWATSGWTPIILSTEDDFSGAMAAMQLADVLLVNPIRDGLNLVAKEGVTINQRDCVLALSRECGAWDELGEWALEINPFDVSGTADVLHRALSMDADERRTRAEHLREAARARNANDWFGDLMTNA